MFTPLPLQIDLLRLASWIRQRQPKLLKSGLPKRRDFLALNASLVAPQKVEEIRIFDSKAYLLFLYEMAYQLDLFEESQGLLLPKEDRLRSFFSLSIPKQQAEIRQIFFRLVLWHEFRLLPQIVVGANPSSLDDPPSPVMPHTLIQARRKLVSNLPSLLSEPLPMSVWSHKVRDGLPDLLSFQASSPEHPYHGLLLMTEEEKLRPAHFPEDWEAIEGAWLQSLASSALVWLGILEIPLVNPDPVLRLRPPLVEPPTELPLTPSLLVQPNLEILVFPSPHLTSILATLEVFALPQDGDAVFRYRLDKKTFLQALRWGLSFSAVSAFLQTHARTPIPDNVLQILQAWETQSSQVVISRSGAIVETSDASEMDSLLQGPLKGLSALPLSPTMAFLPHRDGSALRALPLPQPVRQNDGQSHPSRCLDISGDLRVIVDLLRSDLLALPTLQRFSDPSPIAQSHRAAFQITKASLQRALHQGLSSASILDFLERRARIFPSTARLRLDSFLGHSGQIFAGEAPLLLAPDAKTLDRLLLEAGLQPYLRRIGPAAALIEPSAQSKVAEILASFSLPNQDAPTPAPSALWSPQREPSED